MKRITLRIRARTLKGALTCALLAAAALLSVATSVDEPAQIGEVSPPADAVEVDVTTEVVIWFNTAVESDTVSRESVRLLDPDGQPVEAQLGLGDSWEIVITPTEPLAPDSTYEVVLDLGVLRSIHDEDYEPGSDSLGLDFDPTTNLARYTFTTALEPR